MLLAAAAAAAAAASAAASRHIDKFPTIFLFYILDEIYLRY